MTIKLIIAATGLAASALAGASWTHTPAERPADSGTGARLEQAPDAPAQDERNDGGLSLDVEAGVSVG